jgi:chromosome segregation ATPase
MKRLWYKGLTFVMALSLLSACATIPGIKSSGTRTSGTKSSPRRSKEELYSKVPAANRAAVREAEFDLKQAGAKAALAGEIVKLAELQKQRALLERQHADYGMELAQILQKKAELEVEIRKLEAIDNSNLGDKESNIKEIANVKTKQLSIESDGIQVKAEFDTTELRIKKLTKQIEAQKLKAHKGEKVKASKKTKTKSQKTTSRKRKTR